MVYEISLYNNERRRKFNLQRYIKAKIQKKTMTIKQIIVDPTVGLQNIVDKMPIDGSLDHKLHRKTLFRKLDVEHHKYLKYEDC